MKRASSSLSIRVKSTDATPQIKDEQEDNLQTIKNRGPPAQPHTLAHAHTAADQMCQEVLQWSLQPQNSNKTVKQLKTCYIAFISFTLVNDS